MQTNFTFETFAPKGAEISGVREILHFALLQSEALPAALPKTFGRCCGPDIEALIQTDSQECTRIRFKLYNG